MGTVVRALTAAVTLAALALAGCVDDVAGRAASSLARVEALCEGDRPEGGSRELLLIELDGTGYDVRMPLLVSWAGASMEDWKRSLGKTGDITVEVVESGSGEMLRIAGSGPASVASCVLEGPCCHDAFVDATWSGYATAFFQDPEEFEPRATEGRADYAYRYEGRSPHCSRDLAITGSLSRTESSADADGDSRCSHL